MYEFNKTEVRKILLKAEKEQREKNISSATYAQLIFFMKKALTYGKIPDKIFYCSQDMRGKDKCKTLCSSCKEFYNE